MPTLNATFVLYTDGSAPRPPIHRDFTLVPLPNVPLPAESEEFFGPFAQVAHDQLRRARAAFLLKGQREVRGGVGEFFSQAHAELCYCVEGRAGFAVDLLKMWALPFADAPELPTDPLAEDLFAVSFQEVERDRFVARTHGLAKLDQPEVSFRFSGHELTDEAAMMCAHLADYAMTQSRRVGAGQSMTFGYDALVFSSTKEEDSAPPYQRAVLGSGYRRVPLLEISAGRPMSEELTPELTDALQRSFEQRLVLEEHEVPGDSPHQTTELRLCSCAGEQGLRGWRDEPASPRESGWTFTCRRRHPTGELEVVPLGVAVKRLPQIFRYLALPGGSSVDWRGERVLVDTGAERPGQGEDADSDSGAWRTP